MKKLLVSLLAIAGLVACNQEQTLVQQGPAPMEFGVASLDNATRAVEDPSLTLENLEAFDVWAFVDNESGTVLTDEKVFKVDGKWTYMNKQYWTPNHVYYFTAIAPSKQDNWEYDGQNKTISFTNEDGDDDLIFATTSVDTNGTTLGQAMEPVKFQFNHLLSKVRFTFTNGFATENVFIAVENVTMQAPKIGTYFVDGGVWTLGTETENYAFGSATEGVSGATEVKENGVVAMKAGQTAVAANERLTIPTSEYNVSFKVKHYNGGVLVAEYDKVSTITGIELEKGKAYNFTASITPDNLELASIEFDVQEVNAWDEIDVVGNAFDLQAALDAAPENATTVINLGADIEANVTDVQKPGRKVIIDGCGHKYNGTIKVHGNSNYYADAALTIKNLNFETSTASINCIEALENGSERYSSNITVENCTFTATGNAVNTSVGVQVKATRGVTVKDCTATDMHSLIQAQSCDTGDVKVVNCTVDGKNGVAFKQVKSATVEGTTITADAYGIRFDGNIDNYGITVKNNNVTATQPFIVRKMTGKNNTIALEGTNTLAPTTAEDYQIVITNDSDDQAYVVPTGTYTLTGADNFLVYPPVENYDAFLAKISDDTWYDDTKTELAIEDVADFAAFVETANSGNDFEGKTLKLTGDIDLYFNDITAMADGDPATFRPIGDTKYNGGKPFKGTFDGQGHTIKNLYQNGWDLGYQWGVYGSYGLFGTLEDATVKNVVIEGSESYIEGGDVSFIAGSATGDCVFENITINSGVAATYNNGCGGIIGWSGAGNYTFKDITLGEDVVLGGLWGSFDSSIGGIVGQAEPGATYNFENVTINCRIDAYNDCTASYDYYNYRMCGMIIGRCEETTTIDGKNYPDLSKYNMTFNNVVVNYGDWMNYHYCRVSGQRAVRVEPGYSYGGIAVDRDHSKDNAHCMEWIPFNQLIGGDQYNVKGLPAVDGVTVNYPESFYVEKGYEVEGNTYKIYSGKGFKTIATTVLADGTKNVTIELAKDIDLAGIEWPAVSTNAAFVLDGKGYAIKNLTTSAVEDHGFYSTAMFTSTRKDATIKNLVVENATVTGKGGDNSHGAVLVACNYKALNIEGVTVKNSTVSNCDRSSVIATYLYFTTATVKNCVVEGCTVNSIGTAGALLGMNNSHNFEATGNTVKNTTISSSEGSNKAGILIGTWQDAGTLTESNNVVENSKAINAGTETNNNIGRHA